jgi:hypothetical protein
MNMLIAQLPVASEDVAHPHILASDPRTVDQDDVDHHALEEFSCDRSNLPWVIFRAAHRANHVCELPSRARALLAALARTVDARRPYAAIFARRELLTGRALQSMRTFYRSLDDLEAAALIERSPQSRHGDAGLFGRAYLHLTEKAARLLGLIEPTEITVETDDQPDSGHVSKGPPDIAFARPSATMADGAIYKDLYPNTQKRQPGQLPADLQRLVELGFHQFLIFKLMREAKLHAKRLSDVVEATWEYLAQATHPVSYLRSLLRSPVDFAYQLRARRALQQEAAATAAQAEALDHALKACTGQVFFDADNTRRIEISDDARTINVRDYREALPRIGVGQWTAGFVASLEAGRICPADQERERAFRAKCVQSSAASTVLARLAADGAPRATTPAITQRLAEMKRLLRATCVGNPKDSGEKGATSACVSI